MLMPWTLCQPSKEQQSFLPWAIVVYVDSLFQYIIWHSTKIEQPEKMERKWLFSRSPSLHVGLNGFHEVHVPWFASALSVSQIDHPKLFGPRLSF